MPPPLIPSSFLPHLPRSQNSFEPLSTTDISGHIAILREHYIPPVHGGFEVSDCLVDDESINGNPGIGVGEKERRFSVGLADSMDGLGLGLDVNAGPSGSAHEATGGHVVRRVLEEDEDLEDDEDDEEEEESREHLDPFERDWSEKWLNGVVRRAQGWLEDHEDEDDLIGDWKIMEGVLKDASAALAIMAGTSATGSLTRHLLFPLDPSLEPGLKALRPNLMANPALSPAAHTFLSSLATSPTSPLTLKQNLASSPTTLDPSSPTNSFTSSIASHSPKSPTSTTRKRKRNPAVPVLLHDAPMSDHLSVGVQTWGSAILLGRRMAKYPNTFKLFQKGIRILELGAGTGLLSILCRKLIDLKLATDQLDGDITAPSSPGHLSRCKQESLIVATDFLPEVLANLKTCIDLNFPSTSTGIEIAKLDWSTFPQYMSSRSPSTMGEEETSRFMNVPFDLVLASDCVYDETHAKMLRQVVSWTLRLPDLSRGDVGGTFHILSPIRPTFTPELESIDTHFPPHPLTSTRGAGEGEGLGMERGLVIGTRGSKRGMVGRRGEGRVDENAGYWWWEVGWA